MSNVDMHSRLVCFFRSPVCWLQVCCGARHTLVKSNQGEVFAWGWNKYGQLGLGDTSNRVLPQQLNTEACVFDFECGWWHSVLMLTDCNAAQVG